MQGSTFHGGSGRKMGPESMCVALTHLKKMGVLSNQLGTPDCVWKGREVVGFTFVNCPHLSPSLLAFPFVTVFCFISEYWVIYRN